MNKIKTVVKKELTDILRDKKTIIIMLIIPIVIYPLLMIGMTIGMSMFFAKENEATYTIGYDAKYESVVDELEKVYKDNLEEIETKIEFLATDKESEDILLWLDINTEDNKVHASIEYASSQTRESTVVSALKQTFDYYNEQKISENLLSQNLPEDFVHPVEFEKINTSTVSESIGINIGGSLGMMLLVVIFLCAFYPSVDVVTGERERGTLETLLTLPITNFQMIMSKYIAVSIIASISSAISLISLLGSAVFLMTGLSEESVLDLGTIEVPRAILTVIVMLLVVIAAALLITSISMCFCVFAKTIKEANNYMTPVMLVVMIGSMVGMIPSVKLTTGTSLIPLVNVSLLIKALMSKEMDIYLALITVIVNVGFSIFVIWILAKLYNSENVLFSDGFTSVKLFQKRSDIKEGTIPAVGDTFLGIAVTLLLYLYIGTAISIRNITLGTVVIQVIVLSVPLFIVWYMKTQKKELFQLKAPRFDLTLLGSIITYIGTFFIIYGTSPIFTKIFAKSSESLSTSFNELTDQPFIICVLIIAVMPAICEEIFFRGFLFGSFRNKFNLKWAIFLSGFIFGLYHMSIVKLFSTTLIGICFAYIVSVTKSIYVTMALHFINNFMSVFLMKYGERIEFLNKLALSDELSYGITAIIIVAGVILAGLGILLTRKTRKVDA